ncbi:hypothetical protein GQ44DRAFT_660339 [Phaeosphaeriaceae sp. PMI808]|nr:hypothetical protein GQ44DRAFT_660339 [Phaeosphaeriaceae sp. PMI808]
MGPFTRLLLFLFVLGFGRISSAQQANTASEFPPCGLLCLVESFSANICSPTDLECACKNDKFQQSVTLCVIAKCSVKEALVMQNISSTKCGLSVRNRGSELITTSYVMVTLGVLAVIARIAFRIIEKHGIGLDDWTIVATMIVGVSSAAVIVAVAVPNGLGRDIWTLTPDQITEMLRSFYFITILYFIDLALLKLSLVFFYIRVFPSQGVKRILWATVAFTVCYGVAFAVVSIFQCRPINFFWTKWHDRHQGKCVNINNFPLSNAGISIALDFWSLGIPLWQLWGLKMYWKQKVSVAFMFAVGTFVTIVSILRLHSLLSRSSNVSWALAEATLWSTIEVGVGIICACLPTLRLIFMKIFPILHSSSARNGQYQNYRGDNELGDLDRSERLRRHLSKLDSYLSPQSASFGNGNNIIIKTSSTVRYSQSADDTSLVSYEISAKGTTISSGP